MWVAGIEKLKQQGAILRVEGEILYHSVGKPYTKDTLPHWHLIPFPSIKHYCLPHFNTLVKKTVLD